MNKNKITKQPILFIFLTTITFFLISDCSVREPEKSNLHLVIDAGSSGTRFCLFQMNYSSNLPHCRVKSGECQNVNSSNGLASLHSSQIKQAIDEGFAQIPNEKQLQINHVALLGTGGFRALPDTTRNSKISEIANEIFKTGYPATVKVITGEDEALLAWRSITAENKSDTHGIVEIGGATLQVAAGRSNTILSKVSYPLGMNTVKDKLKPTSACFLDPNIDRFENCKNDLKPLLESLKPAIETDKLTYYGLGNPIQAIFTQLKTDQLKLSQINTTGAQVCQSNSDQLTKLGILTKFQPLSCYLFAFQSVSYENLGISKLSQGNGSWPAGATISGEYFPECR
ncbi:MAG: hypothetical protein H3C43_05215 [Leptonema sp. (in: Bacteria)]|nr:hypothetical protein [Leptonema sp. (in: bacteria)]